MSVLMSSVFALVAFLFACVGAIPVPALNTGELLVTRAGPSGSVIYPQGGTTVVNLGNTGYIYVEYQRVDMTLPDNQGSAYTVGIDMYLQDPEGYQSSMTVTNGFRASPPSADVIQGYFVPPPDACGTYQLVVIEHQFINMQEISFQSAAPTITIQCGAIQK